MIRIGSGLSRTETSAEAALDAVRAARAALEASSVDLAFAFFSPHHLDDAKETAAVIRAELGPRHLVGCVAQGVVGGPHEIEDGPSLAVWAASLPTADIETFHTEPVETGSGLGVVGFPEPEGAALVALLADPYTFPTGGFLDRMNEEWPGLPVVGGLAVGGDEAGVQALLLDDAVHTGGAVGAVLRNVHVLTLVSQGCAPIGRDAVVTHAEGNVIYELAGQPAVERLKEEIEALPVERQLLATRGLLAGLVIDENKPTYERGDYLMRGLLGADEETGAIAVGEHVRVGQTMRFHVRDAASADEDLRLSLQQRVADMRPAGALLFTCNGRGRGMFAVPDHDARLVRDALESDALAGFFCGGEIGPVGGQTFVHGFTATLALFLED